MKKTSDAAERNKSPIADALASVLPEEGTVLELASGSGQHVVHFARRFPRLRFQPSDAFTSACESIEAHRAEAGLANIDPPVRIDASDPDWRRPVDAVLCINMVQVVPYATIPLMFAGAARCLGPGAPLVLYGPYRDGDELFSEGNATFDRTLRERDPSFGVRDMRDLRAHGERAGFVMEEPRPMPANNHLLVFRRVATP